MSKLVFGIDVGGTSIKCGLFSIDGSVLDKWEIATNVSENGSHIIPDIAASVNGKIEEKKIDKNDVGGIGIGVPGPVDKDGIVLVAVNLHWGKKDIADEMMKLTGVKTVVGNDANVAALGEMWQGGGKGSSSLIMVTLGTGVGGGIIVDGKIVVGAHGAGGEIGHANVQPGYQTACNCGNHGCLEQFASATGIVHLAEKYLADYKGNTSLTASELSAKSVFDAYKEGDQAAAAIAEEFGAYLGRALAIFAGVTDPEIFVIGGGVSKAGDILIQVVRKYYREAAFTASKDTPLVLAKLGNDAGIYGAAKLALS